MSSNTKPISQYVAPNLGNTDARLLTVPRHFFHVAWTWAYAAATQTFTLQAWTSGDYAGQYARLAYYFGSGDSQGTGLLAGYSDTAQELVSNSVSFTDARKRGALSTDRMQIMLSVGLMLAGHGRRYTTAQAGAATNGVNAVRFGAGGEYHPADAAVEDELFSALVRGLECQMLPSNTTASCTTFLGNCFLFNPATGFENSSVPSMGTRDRAATYSLGTNLIVANNPDDSDFFPNRLLFSKRTINDNAGNPLALPVTVRDIPGIVPRPDGIYVMDMIVVVDSAPVEAIDAQGNVVPFGSPSVADIRPTNERSQTLVDQLKCAV